MEYYLLTGDGATVGGSVQPHREARSVKREPRPKQCSGQIR